MNISRSKFITGGIVTVAFATALMRVLFLQFQPASAVKIFYIGQTNNAIGDMVAIFEATNKSAKVINITPCLMQTQQDGVWSKVSYHADLLIVMRAHSSAIFTRPILTNCNSWRMPVNWAYCETNKPNSPEFSGNSFRDGYVAFSQAVTNK